MLENIDRGSVGRPAAPPTDKALVASRTRVAWGTLLAVAAIALAVWLPRGFQLDHFVTIDESKWLVRSANFYEAVTSGEFVHAFQHGHPGVTIMYAGTLGYLWQFPDYVAKEDVQYRWGDEFMALLESYGHKPIDMLAAGRTFVVLFNVIALTLAFLYALRLVGFLPALIAFLLIALDPFHAALSRLLHPDSLLSTFMLLASLAYMAYLFAGRRLRDLLAAGAFTALAWLTKTPAVFLLPLFGLLALIELVAHVTARAGWRWTEFFRPASAWRVVRTLAIWAVVAVGVYFLLWPALWVAPQATLAQVFDISSDYAFQGHSSPVFFNGRIYNGDPGLSFYPIAYLWRTTPVVMMGLLLLIPALLLGRGDLRSRRVWLTALGLACFAGFFLVFMNLGAKKFDRYLLPVYMPLDILAALGLAAVVGWGARMRALPWGRWAAIGLVVAAVAVQAGLSLVTFPYYLSYYNPAMGGVKRAPEVMFIGWGEGLDEAARYLNETVDVAQASVASWYERGPFSFFYDGASASNRYIWETDYAVIYGHQWQRELPSRRMLAYFDQLTPEQTISLNGLEYVRIYNMQEAPATDYSVEWGDAIRLVYYDTFSGAMYPGQKYDMTMYFVKTAPLEINYNIKVRMVGETGHELLLLEGWPQGMATAQWHMGEILRNNEYEVEIPEGTPPGLYRIEISFYDPATFDHLPAKKVNNGQPVPDPYVLDYLIVGDWPAAPAARIRPPVDLGGRVTLYGAALVTGEGVTAPQDRRFAPGEDVTVRLFWEAQKFIHQDYTVFVHLVGPDGALVVQGDSQPMNGFIPTSYWPPRQHVVDDHSITIPVDAPPGEYRLLVGWYELASLERLPMTQGGDPIGDAYPLATLTVAEGK